MRWNSITLSGEQTPKAERHPGKAKRGTKEHPQIA